MLSAEPPNLDGSLRLRGELEEPDQDKRLAMAHLAKIQVDRREGRRCAELILNLCERSSVEVTDQTDLLQAVHGRIS